MKFKSLFGSEQIAKLIVFAVSCCFVAYHFWESVPYLNSKLASVNGDSIKNYYTYVFHIINDTSSVNFTGLNYPYGENFVYTDCQPLLTLILKCLPFTHPYLIGILHFLILFSFVITPNILYSTFRMFEVNKVSSAICAVAIGFLPPQLDRISGHYALSYACLIPLALYFLTKYLKRNSTSAFYTLIILSVLYFFIHPYLGFGVSIFSFFAIISNNLLLKIYNPVKREQLRGLIALVVPLFVFKLFLALMDSHSDRPTDPYGINVSIASPSTVFVPTFGPFQHFLKLLIKTNERDWEGISYIGFLATVTLPVALICFFLIKRLRAQKTMLSMLVASTLLLLFSFGGLNALLNLMGTDAGVLKQFRSLGRFAWFFYYGITFFLVVTFNELTFNIADKKGKRVLHYLWPVLFFVFNAMEGNLYFLSRSQNYLKSPNIFLVENLNETEKKLVAKANSPEIQAIMPVPRYYGGSEMYGSISGAGDEISAYMSMLISFHCNKPVISSQMSRTSITETKNNIELLNVYKKDRPVLELLNDKKILVIKPTRVSIPAENRFLSRLELADKIEGIELYYATKADFKNEEKKFIDNSLKLMAENGRPFDTLGIYYLNHKNEIPFTKSEGREYLSIYKFQKGKYSSGLYSLSFHYHYEKEGLEYLNTNFLVIKNDGNKETWDLIRPMSNASGFYNGFLVFEQLVTIENNCDYNFTLNILGKKPFYISDLLFKPEKQDVLISDKSNILLFNGFPVK